MRKHNGGFPRVIALLTQGICNGDHSLSWYFFLYERPVYIARASETEDVHEAAVLTTSKYKIVNLMLLYSHATGHSYSTSQPAVPI